MKRTAVSVLLTSGPGSRAGSRELLLVKRSPALVFFGGYFAFPGGTVDPGDGEVPVENLPESGEGPGKDFSAFVVAAARELFEETGVWMGRKGSGGLASPSGETRRKLLAEEITFREILEKTGHHLDARDFTPMCRITTPPFSVRRYDTWFFQCSLPPGARVEIIPGELEEGFFLSPRDALGRWRSGEILIVPPVIIILEELVRWGQDLFLREIRKLTESYRKGELHRIHFTPGILLVPLRTPTRPPATHTNGYLVGEERVYIVDPASADAREQEKLWALLDGIVEEGRTLGGILLTHHHQDHVGAVAECQRRYRLPVRAHGETVRRLEGIRFADLLEHGEELDLGNSPDGRAGWRLRVDHVPGHAPGHLAFQESRYGALLVGDLISTISSILIDPPEGHLSTYLDSLRFLESAARGTVYPGHGPPVREGKRAIQGALLHRQKREKQLLVALGGESRTVDALVQQVYTDVDPGLLGLATRSLLSGLIKLEEEGKIRKDETGGEITYCLR